MAVASSAWGPVLGHPQHRGVTEGQGSPLTPPPCPPEPALRHLGGVVDELQSRVAGNHRAQIGERASGVEPALRAVHFDGIEETNHCEGQQEEEEKEVRNAASSPQQLEAFQKCQSHTRDTRP